MRVCATVCDGEVTCGQAQACSCAPDHTSRDSGNVWEDPWVHGTQLTCGAIHSPIASAPRQSARTLKAAPAALKGAPRLHL